MCSRCAELSARVQELEEELGYRLELPAMIFRAMKTTTAQSYLVAELYRTTRYLSRSELDNAIPLLTPASMKDKEFRTLNGVSVHIGRLRSRFGKTFILSDRRSAFGTYALSDAGREAVKAALA